MRPVAPLLITVAVLSSVSGATANPPARRPNIVLILADDQGWGDLGCYGSPKVKTPNIDKLAAEGTRFTDCYSGSAVCAPSRCVLMTGLHTGHARRRDNEAKGAKEDFQGGRPLVPLAADDLTVATVLKRAGYVTGGFGKWGLGNPDTPGTPEQHGFDPFFGYLDQVHAHDYYTDHLWRDGQMVPVAANEGGKKAAYSHDLIADAALDFIRRNKDRPFFLYLPCTPPHGDYVVPSDEPYTNESWPQQQKNYAAMITRLDRDVGRVMALLKELKLDDDTIVFYTSDNGPNPQFRNFLHSAGPFRGIKRELYEGGIRCPMIARWPGKVPAGRVSDFAWGHVDFFATLREIAGVEAAAKTDGMSVLPTLLGKAQAPHEFLYWEIYDPRFQQAVRAGNWKGTRFGTRDKLELYDLSNDIAEAHDVAAEHPDVVKRIEGYMAASHVDTKYWPAPEHRPPAPRGRRQGQARQAEE